MNDKKAAIVKEALNKAKLWKDYLELWSGGMRYEQYCNLRRDDYHEEIEHLTPFLDFNVRNRYYDTTREEAFIEMGEHIRQIEIRELQEIYQNLLISC